MSDTHLLQLFVIFSTCLAPAAAQPRCDPITQYLQDGECCKMCVPGTSMTSLGSCLEPQCQKCEDGEYQDKFTKESECRRQPYCDTNINFQQPVHDVTIRTNCTCKDGFHCSSSDCITCVPHTACTPGYGVQSAGHHLQDTVCQKCPEGTFSANTSKTEVCQEWTECPPGQLLQAGTGESDNVCVGNLRQYTAVICVVTVFFLLVCSAVIYLLVVKSRGPDRKLKNCIELCVGEKQEPPKEANPLVTNPQDTYDEPMLPERQASQEEPRTPEEVDYELQQDISITTEVHFTENGKFVMQDKGKSDNEL
ncbi:tumor necrosis factor receptor superfamily member 5 precursor [Takifugu rubripes]|uniref:CD40 n=1 Tax=Takifugu rubripes TaxID=31033 RepID=B8YI09_TAKRU|nr:tumor necrosis factor receptor superfamily member 5 precursor [Takifugu rubripes]ACL80205.1 CD40 [Takifugu rubripes]|eukprot:NP_001139126.1 CD40 antigen precursor [Takifugu rubripes]